MTDRAQRDVDDLEQDVLGDTPRRRRDDVAGPTDRSGTETDPEEDPAFALDLDPEDQGSAGAGASNPD